MAQTSGGRLLQWWRKGWRKQDRNDKESVGPTFVPVSSASQRAWHICPAANCVWCAGIRDPKQQRKNSEPASWVHRLVDPQRPAEDPGTPRDNRCRQTATWLSSPIPSRTLPTRKASQELETPPLPRAPCPPCHGVAYSHLGQRKLAGPTGTSRCRGSGGSGQRGRMERSGERAGSG